MLGLFGTFCKTKQPVDTENVTLWLENAIEDNFILSQETRSILGKYLDNSAEKSNNTILIDARFLYNCDKLECNYLFNEL